MHVPTRPSPTAPPRAITEAPAAAAAARGAPAARAARTRTSAPPAMRAAVGTDEVGHSFIVVEGDARCETFLSWRVQFSSRVFCRISRTGRALRERNPLFSARVVRPPFAKPLRLARGRRPDAEPVDDETRQTGSRGHQRARRAFARRSAPRRSRARVSAPAYGAGARVTGGRGSVASRGARANARRRHGWRPESPSERASVATQLHREPADQPRAVRLDVHAAEGGGRTTLPQGRARGAAHAGDDRAALRPGARRVLR